MPYRVALRPAARRDLEHVAPDARRQIARAIDRLAIEPRPRAAAALQGVDALRLRVGDYRILYQVRDAELYVLVIKIGHRREVYRR